MDGENMFFIVSTGRSGSHAIVNALAQVPGLSPVHEPSPQLVLESSGYRYRTVSEDDLRDILTRTRKQLAGSGPYCESNQTLSLMIPVLAHTFPKAKFVWLIRNGLDQVASAYAKQWYSGHSENHDRYEDCTPLQRLWIDGRIEGDRCGDVSVSEWKSMDRFAHCCWYWAYVNRVIEVDLKTSAPDRYSFVRLEELDVELPRLLSWLGVSIPIPPRVRQTNEGKRPPHPWIEWTASERSSFEHWCGTLMDQLYPTWRTSVNDWTGVQYQRRTGIIARLGDNQLLSSVTNRVVARSGL